ncbi:septum formation inhibitor-activating ATPase (plasmid) [Clostridium botulinum Af84]|uniref:AAA family ATPase n=1 Tax=Clostridium botulinum TaxID=1491 RepID=UPI00035BA202|nr:AAA family ATPase [Clostridium botulinum]APR02661.1 AAA domain protein [Clostridium botulinum]AUN19868.1 semialdehyde dehydrogenase [Clostridium botulinum]EPS54450.1 septum formation inhibitor-activating ATPase [Clostridium botulinum Af84]NFM82816.1 semialdehyde dehydrogenase [Clostridium botulinum]NFP10062.1 semialdehyde dehydrogenase [Clostridium botulinum]
MIISSYCPSGKVGKTTTSLALAKIAEKRGLKTCVLEFDFSPGDIPTLLDLDISKNILDLIAGYTDTAIQQPKTENFKVVIAGYPDYVSQFTSTDVRNALEQLNEFFDLVIVDIQPNFIDSCIDIFEISDYILLVLNNNYEIVSRAVGNLEWGIKSNYFSKDKMQILVNKASKKQKDDFLTNSMLQQTNSELYLPILNTVPLFKNFQGYNDERFLKYIDDTFSTLFPQYNNEDDKDKKEGFFSKLFKGKEKFKQKTKKDTDHLSLPSVNTNLNSIGEDSMGDIKNLDLGELFNGNDDINKNIVTEENPTLNNNEINIGPTFNQSSDYIVEQSNEINTNDDMDEYVKQVTNENNMSNSKPVDTITNTNEYTSQEFQENNEAIINNTSNYTEPTSTESTFENASLGEALAFQNNIVEILNNANQKITDLETTNKKLEATNANLINIINQKEEEILSYKNQYSTINKLIEKEKNKMQNIKNSLENLINTIE